MFYLTNNRDNKIKIHSKSPDFDSFFVEPQIVGLFWLKESCGARILPRVVVGYKDLNFSAYRMCVLQTFNHLYWPETDGAKGNPNLVPEEGWGLTVGFKTSDFPLWVQYNFSYYKNKIRWTNDSFIEGASGVLSLYPTNSGEGIYNIFSIGISQGFFENKLIMITKSDNEYVLSLSDIRSAYRHFRAYDGKGARPEE